jgi:hypothetical protein
MKRFVIILIASMCVGQTAWASLADVYVGQASAGSDSGADCTNRHAVGFFNTAGNWGAGAAQIGQDTTVHLCGQFTGSANGSMLTAQGSGASGHPVIIKFETGAKLSAPYWAVANGAINTNGQSWITIDGGVACGTPSNNKGASCNGIIENTLNGTASTTCTGGTCTNQQNSVGILASNSGNIEIKNILIQNIYQRTAGDTEALGSSSVQCVKFFNSLGNISVHDSTLHDANWCIHGDGSNLSFYNNEIYNIDHCLAIGTVNSSSAFTGDSFHDNHCHDTANWDSTSHHHDGVHLFTDNGGHQDGWAIYNNLFDGAWGTTTTAHIFTVGDLRNQVIYNNVSLIASTDAVTFGHIHFSGPGDTVYNNTVVGNANDVALGCYWGDRSGVVTSALIYKNNIVSSCNQLIALDTGTSFAAGSPNNDMYANKGGNPYNCFGTQETTFVQWKTCTGGDAGGTEVANAFLNSDGSLQTNSTAIGLGANLTSLCSGTLTALCSSTTFGGTKTGQTRPSTGAWDAGADQFRSATAGATFSVSSLAFGDFQTTTSSPTQSVTLTNTGNATLTITSITFTGANPADFSQSNNCGSSLSVGQNCTIVVTFTPAALGCRQALLSVADNAPNPPQQITVSGTGIQAGISIGQSVASATSQVTFNVCINDNGDTLVVGVQYTTAGGPVTGVTDGNGNSWTCPPGAKHDDTTDATSIQMCKAQGISVATQNPVVATVSFMGTPATIRTLGLVYNNVPSGLDQAVNTGCNSSCGASPLTEAISVTTVNAANELFVSMFQNDNSSSLPTASSGFIVRDNLNSFQLLEDNGSSYTNSIGANTCGSIVDTFSGSEDWQAVCLTFAPASGPPVASVTPISLQFSAVVINTNSPTQITTLKNTGGSTLTFTGGNPGISITPTGQFTQTNNCGTSLAASASCTITVTFSPTSTGVKNASVSIADNAAGSPQTVSLQGTGIVAQPCVLTGSGTLSGGLTIKCQ